ncbi:MAG: hypothetical protein E7490_05580 [Ruminococcaceae bacterium]|nr:hypothetical protein [Oscillospiraceae bacterium]
MKNVFSQATEISVKTSPISERLKILPQDILKHTDREYSCEITDKGCYLKPTFRNMPYKNSFVPELSVTITEKGDEAVLQMTGKPVKAVRIFNICFCAFLLIIEVLLLLLFITSGIRSIFPLFIPIVIILLNFLIIKVGTASTFKSVVRAISKELPTEEICAEEKEKQI